MDPVLRAAEAIASALGEMDGIERAYPFPKMQSQLQPGNLVMAPTRTSPPGENSGQAGQEFSWDCIISLKSATDASDVESNARISTLMGMDPENSIIGVLYRNQTAAAGFTAARIDPYLDPNGDGITVDYNDPNGNNEVVDLIRFTVMTIVEEPQ